MNLTLAPKLEKGNIDIVFLKRYWSNTMLNRKGIEPKDFTSEDRSLIQDLLALGAKPIVANAGDFIIWHHALPHGSAPNTANSPRIVQYINYQPLVLEVQDEWI